MKFLIDAHLPRGLVSLFADNGHDAMHVSALPLGFATPDSVITDYADAEGFAVVSKDADFINTVQVSGKPAKLLAIKTGNCSNAELRELVLARLPEIAAAFVDGAVVELHRTLLVVHGGRNGIPKKD